MTVFKGYNMIIKRNIRYIIMYFSIFISITLLIQLNYINEHKNSDFQSMKLNIALIDQEGGQVANALETYLGKQHNIVQMQEDKSSLQEALFYKDINYVATIKPAIEEDEIVSVEVTKEPSSYEGYYVDQQINTFLNQLKVYESAGYTRTEAIEEILNQESVVNQVEILDKNGNGGETPAYNYMFRYFPYLFISILCYVMSLVLVSFREKEVKRRMLCSSVSLRRQNMQGLLAFVLMGIVLWGICMMLPIVLYGGEYLENTNLRYYLMNSFMLFLVALGLSFLVGVIVHNPNVLSNVVNVLSLGLCFLGGAFVEISLMGEGVKKVAQFLPTYWYEKNNDILGKFAELTGSVQTQFYQGMLIQLLFAIACIGIAVAAIKYQEQEA